MKYIITETQYRLLIEEDSQEDILTIPYDAFNNDWDLLQNFLKKRGYPLYRLDGNLNLAGKPEVTLNNLTEISGFLYLQGTKIETLGSLFAAYNNVNLENSKIESLGDLKIVGGRLNLRNTRIKSLGNLEYVQGSLNLAGTNIKDFGNVGKIEGKVIIDDTQSIDLYKSNLPIKNGLMIQKNY